MPRVQNGGKGTRGLTVGNAWSTTGLVETISTTACRAAEGGSRDVDGDDWDEARRPLLWRQWEAAAARWPREVAPSGATPAYASQPRCVGPSMTEGTEGEKEKSVRGIGYPESSTVINRIKALCIWKVGPAHRRWGGLPDEWGLRARITCTPPTYRAPSNGLCTKVGVVPSIFALLVLSSLKIFPLEFKFHLFPYISYEIPFLTLTISNKKYIYAFRFINKEHILWNYMDFLKLMVNLKWHVTKRSETIDANT